MQIVYNGPHPEVVVDELDAEQVISAGQPVEIPDDLAVRLLQQDTWHLANTDGSREDLNAVASAVGVVNPDKLPNKAAVVDTINGNVVAGVTGVPDAPEGDASDSSAEAVTAPENAPDSTPDAGSGETTDATKGDS